MHRRVSSMVGIVRAAFIALALVVGLGVQPAWADREAGGSESGDRGDYGHMKAYGGRHDGRAGRHVTVDRLVRFLLTNAKDIGLKDDQVAKIKDIDLNFDKSRIKTEADILVIERELQALIEDEKSDLKAIEAKLKQSEELEAGLRLAAIKARREMLTMLTPEQREKLRAVHERLHRMRSEERGEYKGEGKREERR